MRQLLQTSSINTIPSLLLSVMLIVAWPAYAQPLSSIDVLNAPPALERNIRAMVNLPTAGCETNLSSLTRFLPDIRQRITRAGRALGYYQLTQQTRFVAGAGCWLLEVQIDAGEPVTMGNINIDFSSDSEEFSETLDNLPIAPGDQLNHALYERTKSDLSARAIELGFFNARFVNSELRLDLQQNRADVEIVFAPGDRYLFGEVEIEPVEALSEDFIQRFIEFNSGTYYSADALINLRNVLSDSFYFSNVSVSPAIDQAVDQRIPVRVGLQLRPRQVYSFGVGATTDIGPRVRLDYEDRYLNRRGHRFEVRSAASPVQQSVDLNYSIPWNDPASERLTISSGFMHEDNDTFISETTKYGANYTFVNPWGWRQNAFLSYQHDVSEINEVIDVSDLLIPGLDITRTRADDALFPSRGWQLFAQVTGASDTLFSTDTFTQFHVNGKLIQTIGPGRVLMKFEAGTTITDSIEKLPTSIQFFSGGDQSVRGYKYQSLGPLDDNGEVVGGKHLLVGGIEYDFNILPNWKLAVFADAGNAFLDFDNYDLKKSVGVGIRWLSPLGPIRVDVASALDEDNKLRLHLTMGPDL